MKRYIILCMALIGLFAQGDAKVSLRYYPYELQLRHAFNLASMSRTSTPGVQVEISMDSVGVGGAPLIGYGEASMPPYLGESVASVTGFLSRVDASRLSDPFAIDAIHAYLDSLAPGNMAAKAAIDIALHDLTGKIMGQPWHRIWGIDERKAPSTSYTISNDSPEVLEQKIAESEPYKVIKVKMECRATAN